MELLPFLYALLAAFTGVSTGDRMAYAERTPVAACASGVRQEQVQSAAVARALVRPIAALPRLIDVLLAPVIQAVDLSIIFRIAGFSVRRQ